VDVSATNEKKKNATADPGSAYKCYEFQQSVREGITISTHVWVQIHSPTHAATLVAFSVSRLPLRSFH